MPKKYILKKDFYICPKGSEVIAEYTSERDISWFTVIYQGNYYKLGNSLTMNVDEWIEEIIPMEDYLSDIKKRWAAITKELAKLKDEFIYTNCNNKKSKESEVMKDALENARKNLNYFYQSLENELSSITYKYKDFVDWYKTFGYQLPHKLRYFLEEIFNAARELK